MARNPVFTSSLALALALASCVSKQSPQYIPTYKYKISIVTQAPGTDPRCTCDQSRAVAAVNTDPVNRRFYKLGVSVFEASTGTPVDSFTTDGILAATAEVFLGCTIASTSTGPQCNRKNEWRIVEESSMRSTASFRPSLAGMGPIFANDAATCAQLCTDGSTACLSLGKAGAPFVAPFIPLLAASEGNAIGVIPKAEILAAYNMDAAMEVCERGDVTVGALQISNDGPNSCDIELSEYTEAQLPVNMELAVPAELSAARASPPALLSASRPSRYIVFEDAREAPAVGFYMQSYVMGGAPPDLNEALIDLYGGYVRSAIQISDEIILSTSNGCISASIDE